MGEMIGNIAHQWRQPLNIISITTSSIKLNKELDLLTDDLLLDTVKVITDTTEQLSSTIDLFRDFLKDNKEKSLFNLSQNIYNNVSLIETLLKDNDIKIELDLDDNIYIYNLANEFSQALINILHNANDALSLKKDNDNFKIIRLITKQINENIIIEIYDNAGGINNDIMNKIFEPYFTTKHKFQGIGLGLYMTHKIIQESMQGDISVENHEFTYENKKYTGALFRITLNSNT